MNKKCPLEQAVAIVESYKGQQRLHELTYMDSFYCHTTEQMTPEDWESLMQKGDSYFQ